MIRPKNNTGYLLLSITKNCEMLLKQTDTKPQETLEFKMTKARATFHINPTVEVKEDWMIGLTSFEVYNSIFNATEENREFELYEFLDEKSGGVSIIKIRNEIEKDLGISDITATDLQGETIGPIIITENREQVTERLKDDKYMLIIAMYVDSVFQDFESFLRTQVDLVEDDFRLVLDQYNFSFDTYELEPGIYTFQNFSKALFNMLQPEYELSNNSIDIDYDDITMKTKLVV